jgi:hypothetical protein
MCSSKSHACTTRKVIMEEASRIENEALPTEIVADLEGRL